MHADQPVAVVTSAAGPLGRAICGALLAKGLTVVALDLAVHELGVLEDVHPGRLLPFTIDITAPGAIEALAALMDDHIGQAQVFVHNAGDIDHVLPRSVMDGLRDFERATHAEAGLRLAEAIFRVMRDTGHGRMIFTLDAAWCDANQTRYRASRASVSRWASARAIEGAAFGVAVSSALHGLSVQRSPGRQGTRPDAPGGLSADPVAIALVVALLAGDSAADLTGSSILVGCAQSAVASSAFPA